MVHAGLYAVEQNLKFYLKEIHLQLTNYNYNLSHQNINMKQFFLAFLVFSVAGANAQKFKPVLKLAAGEKFIVTTSTKGSVSQELMGQSLEIPLDAVITNTLDVKSSLNNSYELTSAISRIVYSLNMMGQDMNYDSDKQEDRNAPSGKVATDYLNKPVDFKVNSFGKIIDGSIKKQSPEKPAAETDMVSGMLNLGDDTDPSQAVNLFETDAAMNIGDSFVVKNNSADGKIKKTATYTLAELKDGIAKFTIAGTDSVTNEMEMQGMQIVSNNYSKSTGEMLVSTATGLLVKKTLNLTVTGSADVAGMSIPISGSSTIIINVTPAVK